MQLHFRIKRIENVKVLLLLTFLFVVHAAKSAEIRRKISIKWLEHSTYNLYNVPFSSFSTFKEAHYEWKQFKGLPFLSQNVELGNGGKTMTIVIQNPVFEEVSSFQNTDLIPSDWKLTYLTATERKIDKVLLSILPVRKNASTGKIEKLISADIVITYTPTPRQALQKTAYASSSVLATGIWYKFSVSQTGVYAITGQQLKDAGIDITLIDPRTLKIYGQGAGMLPQQNNVNRVDDLPENAIVVEGESDGVFNETDRILFYGKAQKDTWKYNTSTNRYDHITNIYTDQTSYFITYGGITGKRVAVLPTLPSFNHQTSEFDHLHAHELEAKNLIKSGRRWLGEEFGKVFNYDFTVNMGNVNTAVPVYIKSSVAAHSYSPSSFSVSLNGVGVINHPVDAVIANFETAYAYGDVRSTTTAVGSSNVNVSYQYNTNQMGALGWLDYFELQSRNRLIQSSAQLSFRDAQQVGNGFITRYTLTTSTPITIWDVTNSMAAAQVSASFSGGQSVFIATSDSIREFISFTGAQFLSVSGFTKVANQNLHGLLAGDLFIITHPQFVNESQTLANLHRTQTGLRVHVVTTDQIYNEFSSGNQDVSAIRDFLRMFYKRALTPNDAPKYVTLFGRASYDYKNRIDKNTNFIPTYESVESFEPTDSYNSDDYIGFLDDNEGNWDSNLDTKELADIAIGRLPAQDNTQAAIMVNKIIQYVSNPTFGDWKTKLVFVADDEDSNVHQSQSNAIANGAISDFPDYNIRKIFIDAYEEENASGGARNPSAQAEVVRAVEQGCMLINYTGHGGELGWASEQILTTDNIQKWTNGNRLPLFVTATCEFSRFDDPVRTSAGEMVLLNPNGGGIALFTTVRLVNSGSNNILNILLFNHIGLDSASAFNRKRLGEIMRLTKNDYPSTDKNERNFTLLGDPAMFLAYPKHRVVTTDINQTPVSNIPDTLKAFAKVTIKGKIIDIQNNHLTSFNGVIYPTVYDKMATYKTIGNNAGSTPMLFKMQNNVIYRGKASVVNGIFSFTFIVPKDIAYEIGYGKLSYIADNGTVDAIGNYQNVVVGKTSDSIPPDGTGPEIKVFMNDEKFVYGGITDQNPTLLIKLRDANGINVTGKGVGRDISMVLNNDMNKTVALNDYYQAKLDSYQEGEVRFKMKDLPAGKNTIKTKAYDIYNNPSDALLEFVVAGSEELALQHILNYPNPFTTQTTFHFDHNKAGEPMTVQVQIYTISGKLIKTLQTDAVTTGNHFDQLSWDGRDDYGDAIGKGVYIYKVKVKSSTGKTAEDFQKLVILN